MNERTPKHKRWYDDLRSSVDLGYLLSAPAGAIDIGVRRDWFPARSKNVREKFASIRRAEAALRADLGREPTRDETIARLNLEVEEHNARVRERFELFDAVVADLSAGGQAPADQTILTEINRRVAERGEEAWDAERLTRRRGQKRPELEALWTEERVEEALIEEQLAQMDPWDQPLRLSTFVPLEKIAAAAYTLTGEAMADEDELAKVRITAIDLTLANPRLSGSDRTASVVSPRTLHDLRDACARGLRFTGETEGSFFDDAVMCTLASGERTPLYLDEVLFEPQELVRLCFVPGADNEAPHPAVTTLRENGSDIFDEWSYAMRAGEALQRKLSHPADTVCRGDCANCSLMCMQDFSRHLVCDRWGNENDIAELKATITRLEEERGQLTAGPAKGRAEALRRIDRDLVEARGSLVRLQPCSQGREGFDCPCTALFGELQREVKAVYRGSDKPAAVPVQLYGDLAAAVPEHVPLIYRDPATGRDRPYE